MNRPSQHHPKPPRKKKDLSENRTQNHENWRSNPKHLNQSRQTIPLPETRYQQREAALFRAHAQVKTIVLQNSSGPDHRAQQEQSNILDNTGRPLTPLCPHGPPPAVPVHRPNAVHLLWSPCILSTLPTPVQQNDSHRRTQLHTHRHHIPPIRHLAAQHGNHRSQHVVPQLCLSHVPYTRRVHLDNPSLLTRSRTNHTRLSQVNSNKEARTRTAPADN